ncbi:uroporphyrinogen-III C-methyltransferase [Rhodovibrionaceae bacterium A322]
MDLNDIDLAPFEPGTVWLVGSGPGDPGLLTLLAVQGLQQADVIVYDALVNDSILKLARADCALEYAGKRGGRPSAQQKDISLRLVELARQGKRVLRLKGGDPFVFGRGGEEGLKLVEQGVPFRIVPGITAGIGGLAYAGLPVTHREINQSVTFVTGHDSTGSMPGAINWKGLAQGSQVLVLYMAIKHLAGITDKLLEFGRSPAEPVAVVTNASLPDQRVLETTLSKAAQDVAEQDLQPPALVVIGGVVPLRAALDWQGALAGKALDPDPLGTRKLADSA